MDDQGTHKETSGDGEPPANEIVISSPTETERSNQQQPSSWYSQLSSDKKIEFWSGVLVAGSTIVMMIFTGLLWVTSTSQVNVMKEQFTALHRPWIETKISVVEPLTFYDNYAEVGVSITIKNGGTAPSFGARPMLSLLLVGASNAIDNPVLESQKLWCSPEKVTAIMKSTAPVNRQLMLPNSEVTFPIWKLQISKPWRLSPNGEVLAAWITGCITYVDESESSHATLTTLLFATSYPFKPKPGMVINLGSWWLAPYGHGAY